MKRVPLRRKTPMPRSISQLRRTGRLRPLSKKRITQDAKRRLLRKQLLEQFPVCQRCGAEPSTDLHEKLRRSQGGSPLDVKIIAVIGRSCHDDIHANPAQARAEGWLIYRGDLPEAPRQ